MHMNWLDNFILLTDGYKHSHPAAYPPGMREAYSYFEAREGPKGHPETMLFGLQYILEQHFVGRVLSYDNISWAQRELKPYFGKTKVFDQYIWSDMLEEYDGYLPLEIKAIPEGMKVKRGNVLMTVRTTDPKFAWLGGHAETLLTHAWYPSSVCTRSRAMFDLLMKFAVATGSTYLVPYQMHDFGFRGVSCVEQAAIGAAAHLVNFHGTDTVPGAMMAREFYGAVTPAKSIPATEHSVHMAWGKSREAESIGHFLRLYPDGMAACVSDTNDLDNCLSYIWGAELKDVVLNRNGVSAPRPDSGYPPDTVLSALNRLWDKFGGSWNVKGFRTLNPKVQIIQGDGVDLAMLNTILVVMRAEGWSSDNIAFGSGGGLLQKIDRDENSYAFKLSSVAFDGEDKPHDVQKTPTADKGKWSKPGRFKLVEDESGEKITVPETDLRPDLLQVVFRNGHIINRQTFEDVMDRAAA